MALYVLKNGTHYNATINATWSDDGHNVNHECPTNPVVVNTGTAGSEYICAEIRNDDSTVTTMENITATLASGTYTTYNENLEKTPGYRVKTYRDETNTGQRFNSIDLTVNDYFVLLFADDPKQHHFAKITEVITDDVSGDALEFSPKLGNEIPKNTKFSVFKGPTVSDDSVVAVTAGLLVNSDDRHYDSLMVSRPLFHFYNERLETKNELDHNTKYKLCYANGTSTSSIALNTISVFTTVQSSRFRIKDRSKYSLKAQIIDNRKTMDDPSLNTDNNAYHDLGSIIGTVATNYTDYDSWALNARRDSDDVTPFTLTGPYQYLHYEDSPDSMNRESNLFSTTIFDSISDKTGIAECKFLDPQSNFVLKNNTQDRMIIREQLEEVSLVGWVETKLTLDSITSGSTNLKFKTEGNYDARVLWGQYEEIKIGDYIGFVETISSASSSLHTVVCNDFWRLETESEFTTRATAPFSEGDKIYRRRWSPKTRTLMTSLDLDTDVTYTGLSALTDHPISVDTITYKINGVTLSSYTESRYNNCVVLFNDVNYTSRTVRVSFGDKVHQLFRLEPERTHYRATSDSKTSLDYAFGKCSIELEIFDGVVEEITEDFENGMPVIEVIGRDNLSKLVSPVINKNTLFTEDIIHSSMSPLRERTVVKNALLANVTISGNHELNDDTITLSSVPTNVSVGDILFDTDNHFIGIIKTIALTVTLEFGSAVRLTGGDELFAQKTNPYTFKKALSSSIINSDTVSSLDGASNKGLFFTGGITVDSSGNKIQNAAGTSSNTREDAVGYNFEGITNIKNDTAFQSLLKDDATSTFQESKLVNGLSDFTVFSVSTQDGTTLVELAPKMGLYLGRVEENDFYDSDNITTTDTTMKLEHSSYSHSFTDTIRVTTTSASILTHFSRNEPVYIKEVSSGDITFIGYFIRAEPKRATTLHTIVLDREVNITITSGTSHEIHKLNTKQTTDLYFLNKPSSLVQPASSFISQTWGLMPFNIQIHDTSSATATTDYISRYGTPTYRLIDLEKGNYNIINEYPLQADASTEKNRNYNYYNNVSSTRYYAKSHRFEPSYLTSTPVLTNSQTDDFTDIHAKQGIFEKRGNRPSRGTNFFDYYLTGNTDPKQRFMLNYGSALNRTWERSLQQFDSKVSRNFLFTTCDLLPESDLRKESLYYGNRDLTDFSIMFRGEGKASSISQSHTKALGGGKSISDSDNNTLVAQISSGPDVSSLTKFGMLRLVEMTLDWHFNSVDAENLPDKDKTININFANQLVDIFEVTDSGGTTLTLGSSDYGASSITLSGTPDLASSLGYTFYSESGYLIGNAAAQIYSATITLANGPYANEDCTKGALDRIFAIETSSLSKAGYNIRGHGSEDTFANMPTDGEIHMLKGAVFQNDSDGRSNHDGYAEDNDDDFHDEHLPNNNNITYSMVDLLATRSRDVDIALPPTFTSDTPTKTQAQNSLGDDIMLDVANTNESDSEPANIRIKRQSGGGNDYPDNMTANVQYHIWIGDGHYLGRTAANQTYNSNTISLEKSYYKTKLAGLVTNELDIKFSEDPHESLISTHRNSHISEVIRGMAKNKKRKLFNNMTTVFLDRYDIEDGGQASVNAGLVSSQITETVQMMTSFGTDIPHKLMLRRQPKTGFAHYKSTSLKESLDGSTPYLADGGYMLFKPHLIFTDEDANNFFTGSATTVTAIGGTAKKYSFTVKNILGTTDAELENSWLNFAPNLTGCYLASLEGKEYGFESTEKGDYYSTDNEYESMKGTGETIPSHVHYIISHTITRTAAHTIHEIVIDNATNIAKAYKVMRVAENTFYDFTPKEIKPYVMSPKYTKKAYSNSCYTETISYRFRNIKGPREVIEDRGGGNETYSETGYGEGVSSMFIIADPSNKGSGDNLVYRSPSNVFGTLLTNNMSIPVGLSDGDDKLKTNLDVTYLSSSNIHELKFEKMANLKGVVSVGEIFTIQTIETVRGDYSEATIGCGVNICFETDDLLNDIFEDEGLEFTKQDVTEYPIFVSPEFRGVSLLTATNSLIDRKNRKLIYDKKFILRDADSALNSPKVFISEKDERYNFRSIKSGTKLFDVYNEIIVYGRNVKAIRKNVRSIKKIGKKTLEVVDEDIYTEYDAEKRAHQLLVTHSKLGKTIELELSGRNLFILRPGDTIELEIPSRNIERNTFVIVEKEYSLDGLIRIKVGENNKGLEDRFSELLLENKNIRGLTRVQTFKQPTKSNSFFETINIKNIRIRARTRGTSGSAFTLGFSTPLNITTAQLGFTAGTSVEYTDLFEEEI
jgi:hypothetical protein